MLPNITLNTLFRYEQSRLLAAVELLSENGIALQQLTRSTSELTKFKDTHMNLHVSDAEDWCKRYDCQAVEEKG